jgi:hypothetical protein
MWEEMVLQAEWSTEAKHYSKKIFDYLYMVTIDGGLVMPKKTLVLKISIGGVLEGKPIQPFMVGYFNLRPSTETT